MDPLLPKNLITTKSASELSGYTSDYLSRLIRSGKISGKKVGHSWLVDSDSLHAFISAQKNQKLDRARELATVRAQEYKHQQKLSVRIRRDLTKAVSVTDDVIGPVPFVSHALALSVACAVVVTGATLARAQITQELAERGASVAMNVVTGFAETYAAVPSAVTARFTEVQHEMASRPIAVAERTMRSTEGVALPSLANPDLSFVAMQTGCENGSCARPAPALARVNAAVAHVPAITIDVRPVLSEIASLATSPAFARGEVVRAYTALGMGVYGGINAALSLYQDAIESAGRSTYGLAVVTRDNLRTSPKYIALAAQSGVDLTHAIIGTEVQGAYGMAALAPASARVTVMALGTIGSTLASATAEVPGTAVRAYLGLAAGAAHAAPALASAVFGTEYHAAERFVAITNDITEGYAASITKTGALAYDAAVRARTMSSGSTSALAYVASNIADGYANLRGSAAEALKVVAETPPLAAAIAVVQPPLSAGGEVALATYQTVHHWFDSMTNSLAILFSPVPTVVSPIVPAKKIAVAPSSPVRPAATRTVVENPTYTTVVEGVSQATLDTSMLALRNDVLGTVVGMIRPVATQAATNETTIQYVNMIQDLSNLIVRNGDFRGGTFTGGAVTGASNVASTNGTFANLNGGFVTLATTTIATLTSGASSLATTTINGNLSINTIGTLSIGSSTPWAQVSLNPTAANGSMPAFAIGSSTGTSLVVTNAGNVGIGTANPVAPLQVGGYNVNNSVDAMILVSRQVNDTKTGNGHAFSDSSDINRAGTIGYNSFDARVTVSGTNNYDHYAGFQMGPTLSTTGTTTNLYGLVNVPTISAGKVINSYGLNVFNPAGAGSLTNNYGVYVKPLTMGSASNFAIYTEGTTTSYFGGNVGIGTTTPTSKLFVTSAGNSVPAPTYRGVITIDSGDTDNLANGLEFTGGAGGAGYGFRQAVTYDGASNDDFTLQSRQNSASWTRLLTVKGSNGNVGIGTTTPGNKLAITEAAGSVATIPALGSNGGTFGMFSDGGKYGLIGGALANGNVFLQAQRVDGTATAYNLLLQPTAGNVGIGTTSPASKLTVSGGTSIGADYNIAAPTNGLIVEGNVGIGTTTPGDGLVIQQTAANRGLTINNTVSYPQLTFQLNGATKFQQYTDTQIAYLESDTSNGLSLRTGGANDRVRIDQNGNVGIGTTSPARRLEVADNTGNWAGIRVSNTGQASGQVAALELNQSQYPGKTIALKSVLSTGGGFSNFFLNQDGTDTFSIVNTFGGGFNVGIGSTSPSQQLSVTGSGYLTGGLGIGVATTTPGVLQTSGDALIGGNLFVNGNSTVIGQSTTNSLVINSSIKSSIVPNQNITYDLGSPSYYWKNAYVGNLVANNISAASTTIAGTQSATFTLNSANATPDSQDMSLIFFRGTVMPNAILSWNSATTSKRFEFNHPLYISDASASTTETTFALQSVAGQTANIFNIASSSGANLFSFSAAGNLGIGTANPARMLDIQGAASNGALVHVGNSGTTPYSFIFDDNQGAANSYLYHRITTNFQILGSNKNGSGTLRKLGFAVGGSDSESDVKLTIDTTGNVGIGTTSPWGQLSVNPNGLAAGQPALVVGSSTATNFIVTNGGNVGIGTAVPGKTLDVVGYGRFSAGVGLTGGDLELSTGRRVVNTGGDLILIASNNSNIQATLTSQNVIGNNNTTFKLANASGSVGIFESSGDTGTAVGSVGASTFVQLAPNHSVALTALASGNVGIGTTSPDAQLVVTSAANSSVIKISSGSNPGLYSTTLSTNWDANNAFQITSIGRELLRYNPNITSLALMSAGGNVGIGTTTPATPLDVYTGNNSIGLAVDGASGRAVLTPYAMYLGTGFTGALGGYFISGSGGNMTFGDNGTGDQIFTLNTVERMRITSAGNVGIGTTTPSSVANLLEVWGNGSRGLSVDANDNGVPFIQVKNTNATGNVALYLDAGHSGSAQTATTHYKLNGTDKWIVGYESGYSDAFSFYKPGDVAGTPSIRFTNAGNVGIGTTSPFAKLSVAGDGYFSGNLTATNITATGTLAVSGAVSAPYFIATNALATSTFAGGITGPNNFTVQQTSGNVGIGTTSPSALLNVYAASGQGGIIALFDSANSIGGFTAYRDLVGAATTRGYVGFGSTLFGGTADNTYFGLRSNGTTIIQTNSTNPIVFHTNATERMRIDSTGNVGIGTTTPNNTLVVTGITNLAAGGTSGRLILGPYNTTGVPWSILQLGTGSDSFRLRSTSDTELFYISNTGNVGIGTTSPWTNLTVRGSGLGSVAMGGWPADTSYASIFMNGSQAPSDYNLLSSPNDQNLFINRPSGKDILFREGNGTANSVVIKAGGNVGIGTTSPGALLHLYSPAPFLKLEASVGTNYSYQDFVNTAGALRVGLENSVGGGLLTGTSPYAGVFGQTGAYPLQFSTTNSVRMTILSGGNVGIGTTSPSYKLQVAQDVNASGGFDTGQLVLSGATTPTSGLSLGYDTTNNVGFIYARTIGNTSRPLNINNGSIYSAGGAGNVGIGTTNPGAPLALNTNSIAYPIATIMPQSPQIIANGHILTRNSLRDGTQNYIGGGATDVSNSAYFLAFAGMGIGHNAITNTDTSSFLTFNTSADNTFSEQMRIDKNGNVGIGTTTPTGKLQVEGSIYSSSNANFLQLANNGTDSIIQASAWTGGSFTPIRFYTSNTERMNILANGNVGIGTTNPSNAKLEIGGSGANRIALDAPSGAGFIGYDGSNDAIQLASKTYLALQTGNTYSEVMRITSTGNVGIGTTTPNNKLSIAGTSGGGVSAYIDNTTSAGYVSLRLNGGGGETAAGAVLHSFGSTWSGVGAVAPSTAALVGYDSGGLTLSAANAAGTLRFYTAGTAVSNERMRIDTSGNVGIGTTTPGAKLDIYGSAAGYMHAKIVNTNLAAGGELFSMAETDDGATPFYIERWNSTNANFPNQVTISNSGNLLLRVGSAERMRISTAGNVGIGTTSPFAQLSLAGAAGAATPIFAISTSTAGFATSTAVVVDQNGNTSFGLNGSYVTIGTTTQLQLSPLSISTSGTQLPGIFISTGGSGGVSSALTTSNLILGSNYGQINGAGLVASGGNMTLKSGSADIILSPATVEKARLTSAGNLGIGTTSPFAQLSIAGTAGGTTPLFAVSTSTSGFATTTVAEIDQNGNALFGLGGGNVGIGTTSPYAPLSVATGAGSLVFQNVSQNNLVVTGTNATVVVNSVGSSFPGFIVKNQGTIVGQLSIAPGGTDSSLYTTGNQLFLAGGNLERMRISTTGNVGIGTTSPAVLLTVAGTSGEIARFDSTNANGGYTSWTNSGSSLGIIGSALQLAGTGSASDFAVRARNNLVFISNGGISNQYMVMNANGNVGIGTTSPDRLLHVFGAPTGSSGTMSGQVDIEDSTAYNASPVGGIVFKGLYTSGGANVYFGGIKSGKENTTDGNYASYMAFYTRSNGNALNDNLHITSAGNVGIGTTTPSVKFTVYGAGNTGLFGDNTSAVVLGNSSNVAMIQGVTNSAITGTANLTINPSGGNVGIGTTTPLSKLAVSGGASIGADYNIAAPTNGLIVEGNVGIGTNSPSVGLQANVNAFRLTHPSYVGSYYTEMDNNGGTFNFNAVGSGTSYNWKEGGVTKMVLDSTGNVGIGTTTPAYKLDVNGTAHIASTLNVFNTSWDSNGNDIFLNAGTAGQTIYLRPNGAGSVVGSATFSASGIHTFYNSAGTSQVIFNNGNVGIGTTTPLGALTVNGSTAAAPGGTSPNGIVQIQSNSLTSAVLDMGIAGVSTPYSWMQSRNYHTSIDFYALALNPNGGNVGIGTTSPFTKLQVLSADNLSSTNIASVYSNNGTQGIGIGYDTIRKVGNVATFNISNDAGGALALQPNGGNVGIGTTSPLFKLDVYGTSAAVAHFISPAATVNRTFLEAPAGQRVELHQTLTGTQDWVTGVDGGDANKFKIASADDSFASAKLTIQTNGNVGIGTTTPFAKLDVFGGQGIGVSDLSSAIRMVASGGINYIQSGTSYSASNADIRFTNMFAGSIWMTLQGSTGNVGIGTTSPVSNLSVVGAGGATTLTVTNGQNSNTFASIGQGNSNASSLNIYGNGGALNLAAYSDGTARINNSNWTGSQLVLTTNGNVGIGTTNPGAALDVNGSVYSRTGNSILSDRFGGYSGGTTNTVFTTNTSGAAALVFQTNINSERMRIDASGNVGIGTTTPVGLLNIYGSGATNGQLIISDSANAIESTGMFQLQDTGGVLTTFQGRLGLTAVARLALSTSQVTANGLGVQATAGGTFTGTNLTYFPTSGNSYINNGGNVGVGITNPAVKLDVAGMIKTNAGGGNITTAFSTSDMALAAGGSFGYGSPVSGKLLFGTDGTGWQMRIASRNGTTETDRVTIQDNGNVGIGTTTPNYLLSTNGDIATYGALRVFNTPTSNIQGTLITTSGGDLNVNGWSNVALQTGSNTRLYVVGATGNVGIGTTSPFATFSVMTGNDYLPHAVSTVFAIGSSTAGTATSTLFSVSASGVTTIPAWGGSNALPSLVLGTDPSYGFLRVNTNAAIAAIAGGTIAAQFTSNGTVAAGFGIQNSTNPQTGGLGMTTGSIAWGPNTTMDTNLSRIAAGVVAVGTGANQSTAGTLVANSIGVGTTTPATLLEVGGSTANVTFDGYKNCTGFTTNANGLVACTASDQRLKQSVTALGAADVLAGLDALNPVSFYWNPATERGTAKQFGLIAQQVQTVFPNLVATSSPTALTPDGTLSVNYEGLISPMILAIQQLDKRTTFIQNAATSTVLTVDVAGKVGIGTTTPNHTLTVAGDVGAIAFVNTSTRDAKIDISYVSASSTEDMLNQLKNMKVATYHYKIEDQSDPLRLGFIAEDAQKIAPEILSPDGKGVDIYKFATFTLAGVQALAAKVDGMDARITSLESRMQALDSGAISTASGSPISLSTSSLASALNSFGVLIQKGIAQFNTLVFRQLVASKDADGTSSAGSVTIITGNTVAQVNNSLVLPSTKVFVTFNSQIAGSWWVSDKTAGSFRVVLSSAQTTDVSFDYFLVQTEGQIATSTPQGITGTGGVTQSNGLPAQAGPDTVAPVITLLGDNPVHVSVGGTFTEPGVSVTDNVDLPAQAGGSLPYVTFVNGIQQVASAATIDTSSPTTYVITYRATDAAGNSSTARRSVIVGNPDGTVSTGSTTTTTTTATTTVSSDTTPPTVTLTGSAAMQLTVGGTFTDPGATATDAVDGDLTNHIKVSGTVDTSAAGSYTLTYSAIDAAGNTGSVSRLVSVVAATTATASSTTATATTTTP